MDDFFELPKPIEPPRAPQRYRRPPWLGAPPGTLPGVVPIERVVARGDDVAVCVRRIAAFPEGFEFDLVTMADRDDVDLDPFFLHARAGRAPGGGLPDTMLRFGFEFPDGSRVTNLTGEHFASRSAPTHPVMTQGGGGGGGGDWTFTHFVWPLPGEGTLTIVTEWPAYGIPLTRDEIDTGPIVEAASRAQVVFSQDHLPEIPDPDDDGPEFQIIR